MEEVGFGFGVVGGEFVVVAKEVEKIRDKIAQVVKYFQSHIGERGQQLFSQGISWASKSQIGSSPVINSKPVVLSIINKSKLLPTSITSKAFIYSQFCRA